MKLLLLAIIVLVLLLPLLLLMGVVTTVLRALGAGLASPQEMLAHVFRADVRRNNALAHATMNVLEAEHGAARVRGRASPEGFHLFRVPLPREAVLLAVQTAHRRLVDGERYLRIHPRCRTSQQIGGLLAGAVAGGLLAARGLTWPLALAALILILLLVGPLGQIVQRFLTTDADVSGLHPSDCTVSELPIPLITMFAGGGRIVPHASYFVSTYSRAAPAEDAPRVQVSVRPLEDPSLPGR
jgi:hypothetical protein